MIQNQNEGEAKYEQINRLFFVLNPINQGLYFKKPIQLDITPISILKNDTSISITPQFLNDGKYYTPAFIIENDKTEIDKNDKQRQIDLLEKIKRQQEQSREIQMPRPFTGRKFCYVCRQSYVDYLEHTNHKSHLHKLKTNRFRNNILHLCRDFFPEHFSQKPRRSNKYSKNTNKNQQVNTKQINQKSEKQRQIQIQINQSLKQQNQELVLTHIQQNKSKSFEQQQNKSQIFSPFEFNYSSEQK